MGPMTSMPLSLRSLSIRGWSRGLSCRHLSPPMLATCTPKHNRKLFSNMGAESKMLQANRLRRVFTQDERPAMGFWQMLPGANISRALARAGADWVLVDCEHGVMDGIIGT